MCSRLPVFLVLLAFIGLGGCADDQLDPGDIAGNPDEYLGKTVTVEGPVARVMTDRAFLLGSGLSEDELLLVVMPRSVDIDSTTGETGRRMTAHGRVGTVRIAQIAESFGPDFDDRLRGWEGRVAVFAERVAVR